MSTADKLNKVLETKEAIKQAIIDKGQTVGDIFADYPAAIRNIEGGGGSGKFAVPAGMKFGYATIETFPEEWDWGELENEKDLSYLFYTCRKMKAAPKLKLSKVTSLDNSFAYTAIENVDMSNWNTSDLKSLKNTFMTCEQLKTVSYFDTSNVTNFEGTFSYCGNLEYVPELNTDKATSLYQTFTNCRKLKSLCELNASGLTASMSSSYQSPISGCETLRNFGGLKGIKKSWYANSAYSLSYESLLNIINGLADGVSGQTLYLHQDCVNQLSDDDISLATSKGWSISPTKSISSPIIVTDLSQIPSSTYHITPKTYDFSQFNGVFGDEYSSKLPCKSKILVFEVDAAGMTNLTGLFGLPVLKLWSLKNTGSVTNMSKLFNGLSVEELTVDFDTSSVTTIAWMFRNMRNLKTIDVSQMDTSNVTDMSYAFGTNSATVIDLSEWDMSLVTDMSGMFEYCPNLTSVTMTGDVSNVAYVNGMFRSVTTEGTFYYNPQYDYSKIIAELPATWTAVPLTM